MISKLVVLLVLVLVGSAGHAFSLSIPKLLIDTGLATKFPKEKLTVKLENPVTQFNKESQKVELCGKWSSKLPRQSGDFCLDFHPQWNKSKGDIEISKLNILKLTAGEDRNLPAAVSNTLNNTLLLLLDGTTVYHVPESVGKHLESIEVQSSSFKLTF